MSDIENYTPEPVTLETEPKKKRNGVGAGSPRAISALDAPYSSSRAEILWPELLQRWRDAGRSEQDIMIRVTRLDPPPQTMLGRGFPASAVLGNENVPPGDALSEYVTTYYHLPMSRTHAKYDLVFYDKARDSKIIKHAELWLDGPDQILALRRAEDSQRNANVGAGYAPHAAPPYVNAPPSFQAQPPPSTQYTPQPQSQDQAMMMQELAYTRGALQEALSAAREGRQPNIPPPPVPTGYGAPPPPAPLPQQQIDVGALVREIVVAIVPMLHNAGAAAPQPPPQAQPADEMTALSLKMTRGIMETAIKQVGSAFERAMKQASGPQVGFGNPQTPPQVQAQSNEGTAEVIDPPDPKDSLPFEPIDVGQKWPDGSPIIYPKNRVGIGTPNLAGALFTNPFIVNKFGEAAMSAATSLGETIKSSMTAGPHVVRSTPRQARPAAAPPPPADDYPTGE
jgi:hypothetical protein